MSTEALAPCRCGSAARLTEGHREHWQAQCSKCGTSTGEWFIGLSTGNRAAKQNAVAAWNRRARDLVAKVEGKS